QRILSPQRLPFRHPGTETTILKTKKYVPHSIVANSR
ncbi:uncharacterized protein METZ01_LOCUS450008, partial [marine metagenome]